MAMLTAALKSLSCRAPRSQHFQCLTPKSAPPFGLVEGNAPHTEQIRVVNVSLTSL